MTIAPAEHAGAPASDVGEDTAGKSERSISQP